MSEFHIVSTFAPPPPTVPTSFVTDVGTVIPSFNVVNINGGQTSTNVNNGIRVIANPNLSNNEVVQLTNRFQGSTTTVGATTSAFITFTPTIIGTYAIECRIAAYNSTSLIGAGYSLFGSIRFDGVNSNLCGTPDKIENEEGTMISANTTLTISGATVSINGVGYAGQTIDWSAVALYTFVG